LANEFSTTGYGLAFSYEKDRSYMDIKMRGQSEGVFI